MDNGTVELSGDRTGLFSSVMIANDLITATPPSGMTALLNPAHISSAIYYPEKENR